MVRKEDISSPILLKPPEAEKKETNAKTPVKERTPKLDHLTPTMDTPFTDPKTTFPTHRRDKTVRRLFDSETLDEGRDRKLKEELEECRKMKMKKEDEEYKKLKKKEEEKWLLEKVEKMIIKREKKEKEEETRLEKERSEKVKKEKEKQKREEEEQEKLKCAKEMDEKRREFGPETNRCLMEVL